MKSCSIGATSCGHTSPRRPTVIAVNTHNKYIRPLESRGNYSATSYNTKLVHWPLWVGWYIWYIEEGTGPGPSLPTPLLAVPNVKAHPSTASVRITVLQFYNGPLLCGFNMGINITSYNALPCTQLCVHCPWHWASEPSPLNMTLSETGIVEFNVPLDTL